MPKAPEVLTVSREAIKLTTGAIDVGGQVIADGWLYVQSGYSMFGQLPGNVLLVYRVADAP